METDESDSESVQNQVMETHQQLEEEAAEEADNTVLKSCTVVLDRLQADNKAAKKELEEKEDMNRKGGKSVSRIPTFHKRPTSVSQITELPLPKKDVPAHVSQPPEKSGSVDTLKSKSSEVRETALPQPSVRSPKVGLEAPSAISSTEPPTATAQTSVTYTTQSLSLSESVQDPLMAVSPRPALRAEEDKSKTSETKADTITDNQRPYEDTAEKYQEVEVKGVSLFASGDTAQSAQIVHATDDGQVEEIMGENPPWETKLTNVDELKDSRSSSDVEHDEDDSAGEESEGLNSGDVTEHHQLLTDQSEVPKPAERRDESTSSVAHEEPDEVRSTKSTKSSGYSSFILFCFLPTTLLLLGGFSQHVWHYGLPMSVAQLTEHLELHWLEGFGLVPEPCSTDCRVHLVESIPVGLHELSSSSKRTIADSWLHLLDKANSSVHIAAFYFTLRNSDLDIIDSTDSQGRRVFEHLKQLESKGVKLQIAVNSPQTSTQDTAELAATGAEVREVDLHALTGGIVHTKLWVVDQKHLYVGSANMDWRSLSQVKEVGLSVEDCSCLALDAFRIFGVYWSIGGLNASLPPYWPARLSALSSSQKPLYLKFNGVPAHVYLSSAPPKISARGRSDDLSTILSVVNDAQKFVYISVMDYLPLSQYTEPLRFWPAIDSALRAAACTRRVQVRLMVSCWQHSPASMFIFLQSLLVLNKPPLKCDIDVKIFHVPSTAEQEKIPFARVNHAKYMVTDRVVYIGTSNWSENYFTHTAGVGLVVNQTGSVVKEGQQTLQNQAEELFLRDWTSSYASTLSVDDVDVCPHSPH
ncbi:phospholipase D3 isoform X2 [Parambassis ranga]|uniref:Phospholipase D3 isoform X2 n=1 Tax=Parambassis ranga TaxID=210632 RepID=A0A6P7J376_9TELE|nr:phospholipase D3-like isoform X2 [Parambassis ranga]